MSLKSLRTPPFFNLQLQSKNKHFLTKLERQKLQRLEEQEQLRILERKKSADNLAGKVSTEKMAGNVLSADNKDPKLAEKIQEDIGESYVFILDLVNFGMCYKGAYWIIQRFFVHYQILQFSLLLPMKLSLFHLLRQQQLSLLLALKGDGEV